jgi:hypothetical protein
MTEARRVRLYCADGQVETAREPIEAGVEVIVRQATEGTRRHFAITADSDADGYVIAIEVTDE